jgi:Asp-tRNA(Asn)/Glu-tRNA(Gln) amidotransferase A subunit family amidase
MDEIIRLSALELRERIVRRELSPLEAVDAHVRRIEQVNPLINAVVANRFEAAREEARALEKPLMQSASEELPPLFGVPCTIKDFYAVRGMPQTGGLWIRKDEIADEDAEVVRRVRAAGAIVLGVTNVPEGGLWLESDNRVYGRTNNPWDPSRTPGGSSGGEGAIVAAGGSPFGMGSDIGGSIRLPAAFCGIAGHKPTGRSVPNTGHWPPLEGEHRAYLCCGPLARRVDDLAAILRVVAGPDDASNGFMRRVELSDHREMDFSELTVYPLEEGGVPVVPGLRESVQKAARALEARGARVERVRSDLLEDAVWIWGAMMAAASDMTYGELVSGRADFSAFRELLKLPFGRSRHTLPVLAMIGAQGLMDLLPNRQSGRLRALGRELRRELEEKLGTHGVLLHPPYARPAPRHGRPLLRPLEFGFTAVFNVLELPATQVPTGLDPDGLPLGVQVVGARGRDSLCLAVARALEEEFGVLTPIDVRQR